MIFAGILGTIVFLLVVAGAKMLDNMLGTMKILLMQQNRRILASLALAVSNFISYLVTKIIVQDDGYTTMIVAAIASGIGCFIAMFISDKRSKDRTYVNVIMSDNKEAMQDLRDFLAEHHITNVAMDSYAKGWDKKTITITAYTETKAKNKLIDEYIENSPLKFKRVITE